MNLFQVFWQTSITGKVVLVILFFMSIQSWYYIINCYLRYKNFRRVLNLQAKRIKKVKTFSDVIKTVKGLEDPFLGFYLKKLVAKFAEIYEEYLKGCENRELSCGERVSLGEKELQEYANIVKEEFLFPLERGLGFLATVGSVAPFIGLFGTVWGIMEAFHQIGLKGSANLAVVAPGIAEALINTAMGLFCAIPAVIAYNHFLIKKENLRKSAELLFNEVFLLLKRGFLKEL